MRCYLAARGLTHLIQYIPWCPDLKETRGSRTKMFINILKIRLATLGPAFIRDIVRNEAHVRMATSVWYASVTLFRLSVVCAIILAGLYIRFPFVDQGKHYYAPLVFILTVTILCATMKRGLRKCIHYMRVREVVYVLESTSQALKGDKGLSVDDIMANSTSIDCSTCDRIRVDTSNGDVEIGMKKGRPVRGGPDLDN